MARQFCCMKKHPDRVFEIKGASGGRRELMELGKNTPTKMIGDLTFKKSYRILEDFVPPVETQDQQVAAAIAAQQEIPAPPVSVPSILKEEESETMDPAIAKIVEEGKPAIPSTDEVRAAGHAQANSKLPPLREKSNAIRGIFVTLEDGEVVAENRKNKQRMIAKPTIGLGNKKQMAMYYPNAEFQTILMQEWFDEQYMVVDLEEDALISKPAVHEQPLEDHWIADRDMYFAHEGTGQAIMVKQGESLAFTAGDIFDDITKEQYDELMAKEAQFEMTHDELGDIVQGEVPFTVSQNLDGSESPSWTSFEETTKKENSMKASRDGKLAEATAFIPEPFFLRQSMISSYIQCPDKMYASYENGYNEESIFTRMGTAIHGVMEDYYNGNKDVEGLFKQWWENYGPPEFDLYAQCRKMVEDYFTRQAKYEAPTVIATELEFQVTINGVPVSGTIDRVDRVDANTIRLVDYKTNMLPFTDDELANSIQFQLYTLAVHELKDKLGQFDKVLCTYEMLRLGYRQHTEFPADQLELFADWVKTIWTKILAGVDRRPKLNKYCGFCQKRFNCDVYNDLMESPLKVIPTQENIIMENITADYEMLKNAAKIIKGRTDELEVIIKQKIAENQGPADIGTHTWSLTPSTRYVYPTQKVFAIMAMNGQGDKIADLVSLTGAALERVIDDKEVLKKIQDSKEQTFGAPKLSKKKIKPAKKTKDK